MNLIIEISNIKNCIEQLRTLARQYESYTDVFAPSNFSVPSGTPLSRKLTDVRNNYRGIQINLQLVAQFLEYYVSDLENLENKMGNLGAVASFHSNLSLGSISETSGLVEKPYSFPKTRIFDGASNVTFADSQLTGEAVTYNLPLASAMQFSVIDEKELNKKMLELIIKDQSYGLPLANPESVFLSKGEQKVLASIYAHQYDESISSQEKEIDRTQKEIDRLEDITKPIEKELVGYGYSLESYRREKGSAYSQAFLEAKTLVDDYRNNPASASKIGLTSAQMSKMSDDALARIIVQKDSSVGLNYQNLLKIGDKVGYTLEFEKKLQAAYKENNDAVFAKNHLEQEKAAIPYQLLRKSKEFNEFTYEVPKASVEVKRTGENNYYVEYPKNSSVDEYAFLKSYKEKNVAANLRGISDSDAYLNMISLSDEFPELEKEYYYILKSQGKEAARDYVLNMEGTVNQLVGEREAAKRLATLSQDPNKVNQEIYNLFGTAVYGYGDGVVSNLESISHIFDEKRCYSASEYTKMYFASAIVSQDEKLNGKYLVKDDRGHVKSTSTVIDYSIDYGKYLDIPYNTMQAVGNMTPSMLVGSALGPFGNTAARIGSSVMLGLGSYGSKYHQTMVEGYSKGQAVAAGLASATLEVGSEAALGGLPIFDDTPVVDVFGYAFKGGKEGLQEGVQSVNDLFIDSLILGKDVKMTWKDTQNEMMYGALSALVLGVPGFYSGAKNYNLNRNNLYLLGQDYNTGAISLDEARTLTESLLGYEKISDNDAKYLLKMNKQNVSTLTQSASGSINPAFLQLLNHYHVANSLSVQQQELLNSTPGLQEVLQNKAQNQEAFVPDSLKEAYDQYQSLEEKLNKVDKVARDSAKEFTLREDSLEGIRSRMEELKNNPELQAVIKNHDSGETTYVPSELSDNFNEYLNLKNQERHLVQQLDEIKNKVHVDLGHRVHSLASSVANSVASSVTQAYEASAVVGIVPPVIRDIMNVFGGINSDTSPFHIDKKKYPKVIRQYMNDIMQDLNVSAQTGHVFESLFEDDEYVYGIHQAGRNKGETILKDGLRLTGHSGKNGVSVSESVNLTENVSFHKSGIEAMPWAFRSILSADSYNDAMGTGDAVIFAFPKSMFLDLDTGDYDVKPGVNYYTVDKDTQMKYLDPKYIVGYVTNDHGKVSNFNFNPSYLNSSFLEKNGFRTQVSQNNTTDGEIDNRYNQQMTLESLQNKVEFQTSFLNKFNSDVEQLCQENEEFRAYLQNPTNDNISIELQQSIDKYNQLRESYSLSQSFVIDDYLSNQEDIRKLLAGRAISELNTTEYNQYKGLLRKQNWCFFQSSSVAEQLQFINDCTYFAQEGDIINNIESFDKRVQDEIVKKLLKEQTGILARNAIDYDTYEAKMFLTEHLEFISDISSQNLAYLYKVSDNKAAVLNEVLNRVRKGDLVLDSAFDLVSMGPGLTINPSQLLWDDIVTNRPDITSEVVDLYNSMKTPLYNKMFAEIGDNLSELQRLSLASLIYHNHITEKNVSLILKALSQPGIVPNINIGIYQDDIIQDLGIDFVNSVARFPSITSTILSLKEQSESAYYYFVNIVKGSSGRSLNAQEELVMNALTYLSEHSSVDYSKINLDDFEQFLFVSSAHPELNLKYTDNFSYDFKQVYMNQLFATNSLEEGKNAYFMAKYSMSLDEVQDFLHTYGTDIEEVSDEMNLLDYKLFNTLKEELSQNNLDELKKMYSNSSNYTKYQMLDLGSSIKSLYTQEYANAFKQTKALFDSRESRVVDGVKVISVQGNFDLLLRSTNSGVNQFGISKPDSWVHSYENPLNPSAVGVSTCYVNQNNFGYMKTGDAGVLYGYVPTEASSILTMGTQDIDAQVTSYGARANAGSQYVLPNHMAEYNTRGYSEFEISFDHAKPDYVVLMSDATEQVRSNTFEAAKEWGIPVLEIDIEQLANQQASSINSNIEKFRSTGDSQYLLKAISLYESSANSFGFNAVEKNDVFFDDRSHLKNIFDDIPIHTLALEYAQNIVNSHNSNEVLQFKNGLQNILNYYKNTNENSRVVGIPHTENVVGIDSIMEELNKISDSEVAIDPSDEMNLVSLREELDSSLSEAIKLTKLQKLKNFGWNLFHDGTFSQYLLNQGNKILNTPTLFASPTSAVATIVSTVFNPFISKFMFNSNVVNNSEMSNKILNEGLYHFVTSSDTMQKILDSHKFLATSSGEGYVNTAFFFAGVPSFDEACYHLNKGNNPVDKIQGFRLIVDSSQLSEYQYRAGHDGVVMHLGDVAFNNEDITPVYLVAKEENGNISYVEVSKEDYDNYESNISSNNMNQLIRGFVAQFSQNVDNVKRFNRVFNDFKIGLTNGQVVNTFVSNLLNLLNVIPGVNFDLPINQSVNANNTAEDLQTRLETLRRENPGIEEEYIRIEKEINLEHAVRLTPEMVEYRSIMHQLGLDKNNNVNNQQVETLPIEDDTFTIDDIKSTVLDVSLYNNKYFTVTLVDPKSIYAIIFDSDVYHNFMDFNNHRNEFGDISYPLYLKAIEKFISIELDGRNFGSEISQRIFSLLELINHSNDYLCPVKTYNIDETATSYQVKKNRLEALINQYPSLLTNKNDVPLEVIKEATLLQKAIQGSKYDSLIEASVPCLELSSYTINGELVPIPVELIEQILSDEKTYQAFQDFNHSRFIFGDVSARDYYRAIMLYYLEAKKNGKSISDFKNLDGLLKNMNQYLNAFEVCVVNGNGSPVMLKARLNGEMKEFLEYLASDSIIVSGGNRYTVNQAKQILNNNQGVIPTTFFEGLRAVDSNQFKVNLNETQEMVDISWLDSVLNDEKVFDDIMNHFDFKTISSRTDSLQEYVEQKGNSITDQELNRYHQLMDRYQQLREVIDYIQNSIFKHPELYYQIKEFLEKNENASSVEIGQKLFNRDICVKALEAIGDGVQNYQMGCQAFQDFATIFFTGKSSDRTSLKNVYNAFVDAYNNDNSFLALGYLNKLRSIKAYIPEFCFLSDTITSAFFDGGNNYIELGKNSQTNGTIYHEITHAIDCYYSNYEVSNKWDSMIKQTKKFLLKNETYKKFCKDALRAHSEASNYADSVMERTFHKTKQQILKDLETQYENKGNVKELFLNKMNQQYGLNENDRRAAITDFSPNNLAKVEYELMSGMVYDDYMRTHYPEITAISDMLEGVFSGNHKELKKYQIYTPFSHGEKYYKKVSNASAVEAIANFGSLMFTQDGLNYLQQLMGQEYVDMLAEKHHNIIWR